MKTFRVQSSTGALPATVVIASTRNSGDFKAKKRASASSIPGSVSMITRLIVSPFRVHGSGPKPGSHTLNYELLTLNRLGLPGSILFNDMYYPPSPTLEFGGNKSPVASPWQPLAAHECSPLVSTNSLKGIDSSGKLWCSSLGFVPAAAIPSEIVPEMDITEVCH